MGKFCPKCGVKLEDNQKYCASCGSSLESDDISLEIVEKIDKNANTGFILGIVSIVAWFIPLFGYPVTICGIIFSSKGLASKNSHGKAIAGLVLSIIFLVITLINSIAGAVIVSGV